MRLKTLLLAMAMFSMALPALAQNAPGLIAPPPDMRSNNLPAPREVLTIGGCIPTPEIDANRDNLITKEEWMVEFDRIDVNHDGNITPGEMKIERETRLKKWEAGKIKLQDRGNYSQ